MNLPWRRKLPTGEALVDEARRLGVSEQEIWKGGAEGHTTLDESELQRRVLAAWTLSVRRFSRLASALVFRFFNSALDASRPHRAALLLSKVTLSAPPIAR
jgi:hypothetical protein